MNTFATYGKVFYLVDMCMKAVGSEFQSVSGGEFLGGSRLTSSWANLLTRVTTQEAGR